MTGRTVKFVCHDLGREAALVLCLVPRKELGIQKWQLPVAWRVLQLEAKKITEYEVTISASPRACIMQLDIDQVNRARILDKIEPGEELILDDGAVSGMRLAALKKHDASSENRNNSIKNSTGKPATIGFGLYLDGEDRDFHVVTVSHNVPYGETVVVDSIPEIRAYLTASPSEFGRFPIISQEVYENEAIWTSNFRDFGKLPTVNIYNDGGEPKADAQASFIPSQRGARASRLFSDHEQPSFDGRGEITYKATLAFDKSKLQGITMEDKSKDLAKDLEKEKYKKIRYTPNNGLTEAVIEVTHDHYSCADAERDITKGIAEYAMIKSRWGARMEFFTGLNDSALGTPINFYSSEWTSWKGQKRPRRDEAIPDEHFQKIAPYKG